MGQSAIQFTSYRTRRGAVVASANAQGLPIIDGRIGNSYFVDTVDGSDTRGNGTPFSPYATMAKAFTQINRGDTIYVGGKVREQLVAPLVGADGLTLGGVRVIGTAQGGVRDDDAAKWTYPASDAVAGKALLRVMQQGWEVHNLLWTPEPTGGACVELFNSGEAVTGEGGHFIAEGNRFVGIDVTTTYGIRDLAGSGFNQILNNQFFLLTTGIYGSGTAVAVPWGWQIKGNRFMDNTNHLSMSARGALVKGNAFMTEATVNINLIAVAGQGQDNVVTENTFKNAAADITQSDGWTGSATDQWAQNYATDQAVFGVPA